MAGAYGPKGPRITEQRSTSRSLGNNVLDDDKNKMILLVEDNPDDELLTLRALRQSNIANDVRVARDGAEAISLLFPPPETPEDELPTVVLLDLKLPKIDGLEVLRRIRSDQRTAL